MSEKDVTIMCDANCKIKTRQRYMAGLSDDEISVYECTICGHHNKVLKGKEPKEDVQEIKKSKLKEEIRNAW